MFKLIREDTGQPHPAELNKPGLRSDCIRYYDAFCYLGSCRLWSQVGPSAIQISEIESYLRMVGIGCHETQMKYMRVIRQLDGAYLDFQAKKAK